MDATGTTTPSHEMSIPKRGSWYMSVIRRAILVPFAVAFVLGVAIAAMGSFSALGEIAWDRDARIGEARVVERYIKPKRDRNEPGVDTRIVYEIDAGRDGIVRGDMWYPVYIGWERLQVGDRVELEYLPNGEARFVEEGTAADRFAIVWWYGLPLILVGGGVALSMVVLEFRARRLSWETIAAAMDPSS